MFSYLRPHQKRAPSNPSSPADQSRSFEPPIHANSPLDHAHPRRYEDIDPVASSASLPHIMRVSSAGSNVEDWTKQGSVQENNYDRDISSTSVGRGGNSPYSNHHRFPSLPASQRPESAGNVGGPNRSNWKTGRPINAGEQKDTRPTDQQSTMASEKGFQTGRRPAGVRLPTPPMSSSNSTSTFEPVQQHKSGKTRLNLLNPMSLLARRRTSQAVPQLLSESLVTKRGSETYDFQIKGKFVHDFSAPRSKRAGSYDSRAPGSGSQQDFQRGQHPPLSDLKIPEDSPASPWSGGNHTPVFTENFDEEQYPAAGPNVRKANDISDLPLPQPPYARGAQKVSNIGPSTAHNTQHSQNQRDAQITVGDNQSASEITPFIPVGVSQAVDEKKRISIDTTTSRVDSSSSSLRNRSIQGSEAPIRDGIPRHMKSTSSRFSFDMIGAAEQERVLEERHRQKALDKKNERSTDFEEYDEDYDYDDMMDDDGLEEKIPGVNTDLDEDNFDDEVYEEEVPGINADVEDEAERTIMVNEDLGAFTFQNALASPISQYTPAVASTPRDANGEVIGFAMSKESPYKPFEGSAPALDPLPFDSLDSGSLGIEQTLQGLGLQGIDLPNDQVSQLQSSLVEQQSFPPPDHIDDDDLYFDDGIIGDEDGDDAVEFDESVFDNLDTDQYGRPIRSLSSLPTLYSPPQLIEVPSPSFSKSADINTDLSSPINDVRAGELAPQPSVALHHNPVNNLQSLTQDSLAAYQSALAEAANRAAAEGKFRRESNATLPQVADPQPTTLDSSQDFQPAYEIHQEPFSSSYDLEDDFDYDDSMEDDAIIAAANAEALANDSDGFYGQEFNFYSAPAAKEAEFVNGGYFGPRGAEGINRSTSARVASREPNLTPITERSESSNRNSVMGFSMNRSDIASPGLVQLAGMLRDQGPEGDLSLDALMKLRRGAWGGSQASLHSSNGGSPRSALPFDEATLFNQQQGLTGNQPKQPIYARRNSGFNGADIVNERPPTSIITKGIKPGMGMEIGPPTSEPSSMPPSPTYVRSSSALSMDYGARSPRSPNGLPSPSAFSSRRGSVDAYSKDDQRNSFRKHRYTGSAESISYVKEDDEVNGERWILERRRTADSGEVEIDREVVSGGRI